MDRGALTLPDTMFYPALVVWPDTWSHRCHICTLGTQGGLPGLIAHCAVVHSLIPAGQLSATDPA
jgi:hypothetical protein